jgi:uncharacterized RDD family membrane protein YckC
MSVAVAELRDPLNAWGAHGEPRRVAATSVAPDRAVRARVNAAVLDGILLGIPSAALAAHAGTNGHVSVSGRAGLLALAAQFLYFTACEAACGQTIGKRAFRVRVVALDGSPITLRMAAVRNMLRLIDVLPLFYASGLLSLVRTGAGRRQRIGDVAAGTTVTQIAGRRRTLPAPRAFLPIATLVATAASIAAYVVLINRG